MLTLLADAQLSVAETCLKGPKFQYYLALCLTNPQSVLTLVVLHVVFMAEDV